MKFLGGILLTFVLSFIVTSLIFGVSAVCIAISNFFLWIASLNSVA